MQEVPHSVCGHIHSMCRCTHEAEVSLTISGHELLFISLDFMVQNDYGFRGGMMNILTRGRGLHGEYTYQAVNTVLCGSL